ncbi:MULTISPECIES: DUF6471 domain-containing protein [Mucilaginibacter]|uniref:DUF6471 domain-containing protein n=1 Tax=Mucilaginibacter rubeus TaxID=2027860 RepID=A0ABX7UD56_9SPHI|nr:MULTISPECIES: DUF6471 domain-containing protein [Mucilaginibacter]QTE44103.1 hypothetical protein J3L19_01590 [Mucilaginibacter rubeus]QTE50704.1 hypothetical protein J3L21_01570 [Mucilaginibacter rubeus]QTE55786.1 hypothetical protein J3L23_26805 [Mucilaginibacter rubeus]QTE64750.1 hypothetical protein J3L22_07015 [Mucilaginibacter rubeus]QTF63508.1 hypothetical protein J3L20_06695 [Mucilaginibacter rubeus]
MNSVDWHEKSKRLLKSELLKRGITSEQLVGLLDRIGVQETKGSIDSKISRGTFSAAFLIQCLNAIGCRNFSPDIDSSPLTLQEPIVFYNTKKTKKNYERG